MKEFTFLIALVIGLVSCQAPENFNRADPLVPHASVENSGFFESDDATAPKSQIPDAGRSFFMNTERKRGGKVFFRGAWASMNGDRGNEVFTDTMNATKKNNDSSGYAAGAGLDIDLGHELLYGDLFGEIYLEYARLSDERVTQATSVLLGGSATSRLSVAQLSVIVAPKIEWQFDEIRPWIIPVGMGFLVNSPPSNDTTYLDLGAHFGAGVEYHFTEPFCIGADVRYTAGIGQSDTNTKHLTAGLYLGIDF